MLMSGATKNGTRKTVPVDGGIETGSVRIERKHGKRWVYIDSYYKDRAKPTVSVAYCREDELQGLIDALNTAREALEASQAVTFFFR